MATVDGRFNIPAEKYLAEHHVLLYLEDAVAQLLEYKDENPKVNTTKFFSEYFASVREGSHIIYREFSFIQLTPHNRASFINLFWKCFRQIGKKGDLLTVKEYHAHVCLLCQDFPFEVIQKTARIVLMDDAMDCLISFSDFLYAFQVQFYYEEFLTKCSDVYKAILSSTPRDTVVVPTQDNPIVHQEEKPTINGSLDGVDSMQFYRALLPICDKCEFSPPPAALKSILLAAPRVSFYGFLMALSKCDVTCFSIGVLPKKDDIYVGAENDLVSTPPVVSRPNTAHNSASDTNISTTTNQTPSALSTTASSHSLDKRVQPPPNTRKSLKVKKRTVRRVTKLTRSSSESSSDSESSDSDSNT